MDSDELPMPTGPTTTNDQERLNMARWLFDMYSHAPLPDNPDQLTQHKARLAALRTTIKHLERKLGKEE